MVDLRAAEPAIDGLLGRQAALRRRHPVAGFAPFSFPYLTTGFGRTGLIVAGLAVQALTAGGVRRSAGRVWTTAALLVAVLLAAALVMASAQQRVVERLQAGDPTVKRWAAGSLWAIGWFITLAGWAERFARLFPV